MYSETFHNQQNLNKHALRFSCFVLIFNIEMISDAGDCYIITKDKL